MMTPGDRQLASLVCSGIGVLSAEMRFFGVGGFWFFLSLAFFVLSFFEIPEES